ncbi:MAG TPA: glycosyltransferase [Thermoanaerobaculia bacterium]|nr:glycosyltransferase [Thermoanaerobaculia bacterium]
MATGARLAGASTDPGEGRPIRLLWLIDSLTMGGAESLVVPFARASRASGLDLTVCARTTIGGNPLEGELRDTGVAVENLEARSLRDRAAFRRLMRLIRSREIDVIHAHLAYSAIWGALAARRGRVPLVASLHVPPDPAPDLKERIRRMMLVALLNRYAFRVVMVSAALADAWRSATAIRPERIAVIHNGVPVDRAGSPPDRGRTRMQLGLADDAPVVMTVSVLREGKGIDVLLHAAKTVLASTPSCRFVIVGDGPMRESWEALARQVGIAHAVQWTGFRRDVAALLAAADLFVLPTLADAFPTAVLEALAAGRAVVATGIGGVREMVDSESGRLVPAGDPAALAATIRRSLDDSAWLERAGRAGRARVEREFSTEAWVARLRATYRDAISGSGRGSA